MTIHAGLELKQVYTNPDKYATVLWDLLKERKPEASISHKHMPTMRQHLAFIDSQPYKMWAVITKDEYPVGACYLTNAYEIGIQIFERWQGNGFGEWAVGRIIAMNPTQRLLANINPKNEPSIRMFEKLGFTHIQNTYELRKP
jgi:RimJ/RimL family protein N-acetyltransferase